MERLWLCSREERTAGGTIGAWSSFTSVLKISCQRERERGEEEEEGRAIGREGFGKGGGLGTRLVVRGGRISLTILSV